MDISGILLALIMLAGGVAGGYAFGRKAVSAAPSSKENEGVSERTLAYSERFRLSNQWQTVLASFQSDLPRASALKDMATSFTRAVHQQFEDVQIVFAIGPLKDILLLHTLASAHHQFVELNSGSCFFAEPAIETALLQELTTEMYDAVKKRHATDTHWFLLRDLQPALQRRLADRYGLQGQGLMVPLMSGTILCGVVLLTGPHLAKNADILQDNGQFAALGADIITTWIRCMAPQLLAGTADDPVGSLPIQALTSLAVLEHSVTMLQESAEAQDQVAELAHYARAINDQEAEISLLASQTCQTIRHICQADFALFLCPPAAEPTADIALYAVDAGSWTWSSYQGYQGISGHPTFGESAIKRWPDRFVAQVRTKAGEVVQARTRTEALLLAKDITESLGAESLLIVPAHIRTHCAAIIVAGRKQPGGIAETQVLAASSVAALASMSLAMMQLLQQTQTLQQSATEGWKLAGSVTRQAIATLAGVLQKHSILTATNPQRVAEVAETIALRLRLSPADVSQIRIAALLCDLGMLIVPFQILRKAGGLSPDELRLVQRHPEMSVAMLEQFDVVRGALPMILHHHERYDGTGYPKQLGGMNIPRGAAIIAVADAYVHMQKERPYRPAMTQAEALAYMKQESGGQFDPVIVQALVKSVEETTGQAAA
jgi:HD-GYP domain-containing protein (c-di-GMP phosphodiesterase class II)